MAVFWLLKQQVFKVTRMEGMYRIHIRFVGISVRSALHFARSYIWNADVSWHFVEIDKSIIVAEWPEFMHRIHEDWVCNFFASSTVFLNAFPKTSEEGIYKICHFFICHVLLISYSESAINLTLCKASFSVPVMSCVTKQIRQLLNIICSISTEWNSIIRTNEWLRFPLHII